jgi:hypothetical protein
MKPATVQIVNGLYEVAKTSKTEYLETTNEVLRAFHKSLKQLKLVLGDAEEEEIWKRPHSALRRLLYALLLSPLPFNHISLMENTLLNELLANEKVYRETNPIVWQALEKAVSLALQLRSAPDNPLFSTLLRTYPRGAGRGALLLQDSRLVPEVEELLHKHPLTSVLRVVTAWQLKGDICFDRLVIIGPSSWHPDYVFESRRAAEVAILKYDWLQERPRERTMFLRGWGGRKAQPGTIARSQPSVDGEFLTLQEIAPAIDWSHIHRAGAAGISTSDLDNVPARLVVLEGGVAVFLENDATATVLVIDLEAEEVRDKVARNSVGRIRPGLFIVLRSSGDGDYIVSMANKLMGAEAPSLRARQLDWKRRLRALVNQTNLLTVSIELLDAGSMRASENNLRNWMSPRNIRTNDEADFTAITRIVGLGDQTQDYWNSMESIARYHQRAGQQIRRQLLRKLQTTDLTDLERLGRLDISLPEGGTGALTAFRIIAVEETPRLVNANRLNQPFSIGGEHATYAAV